MVTDVPALECASCGDVSYDEDVAVTLDALLTEMLDHNLVAVRHFPNSSGS